MKEFGTIADQSTDHDDISNSKLSSDPQLSEHSQTNHYRRKSIEGPSLGHDGWPYLGVSRQYASPYLSWLTNIDIRSIRPGDRHVSVLSENGRIVKLVISKSLRAKEKVIDSFGRWVCSEVTP
jgi:hypothetical protein